MIGVCHPINIGMPQPSRGTRQEITFGQRRLYKIVVYSTLLGSRKNMKWLENYLWGESRHHSLGDHSTLFKRRRKHRDWEWCYSPKMPSLINQFTGRKRNGKGQRDPLSIFGYFPYPEWTMMTTRDWLRVRPRCMQMGVIWSRSGNRSISTISHKNPDFDGLRTKDIYYVTGGGSKKELGYFRPQMGSFEAQIFRSTASSSWWRDDEIARA